MNSMPSICWYLCGLFFVACVTASAITVVPAREPVVYGLAAFNAACSVLFGGLALKLRRSSDPSWVLRLFQGIAVVATILVFLVSIG